MIALISLLVAAVTAIAVGAGVRRLAPVFGAVVPPRPDRWHSAPTPTMGGMAIVGGNRHRLRRWRARGRCFRPISSSGSPVLVAGLAMFAVGVFDDRLQLSPVAKLVASLAVGAFLVFALAGVEPDGALPSSYTLIANGVVRRHVPRHEPARQHGRPGGRGRASSRPCSWLRSSASRSATALVVLLVALAGALAGFLYWNRPPARLFMGDCGSLFIGAMLGGVSLVPVFHAQLAFVSPAVLAVLILVVPLFDTGVRAGAAATGRTQGVAGGTDHVSHRLVSLGFSERSAVRILYRSAFVGGVAAWVLVRRRDRADAAVVAVFGRAVILLGIYLARVPAYNAEDFIALQKSSFAPFLKDLAFRWHAGQVMLDLVLITVCYYAAYRLRFEGDELRHVPAVLHRVAAGRARCASLRRSTFGAVPALVGDVRPARSHRGRRAASGWARCWRVAVASLPVPRSRDSRASCSSSTRCCWRWPSWPRALVPAMNLVASARNKRSRRVLVYGAGGVRPTARARDARQPALEA